MAATTEQQITDSINSLRRERKAVILAHNYQNGEVQDIADFTGDSLELSRKAAATDADVIVFCGVHFMAETAKILSPQKTVLLPDPHAGCPMANMVDLARLREFKAQHPGLPVVAYVNTTAEVKAESDICCTSANAVKVVEAIDADEIICLPDKSLAGYIASQTKKRIVPYPGYCPTHHRILSQDVMRAKKEHPTAKVLAHPECTSDVVELADVVASTSGMIRWVAGSAGQEFILCTERGIIHKMQKDNPGKKFYNPCGLNICPNMKKITLEKVLWSLEDMVHEVTVPDDIISRAQRAIEGMLAIV
ncbi:MAG: quinolinate synthase NadA [Armatimonadetes bacterium]|nr:quinolinate synthase NadA [Armatimonadota bacterium]